MQALGIGFGSLTSPASCIPRIAATAVTYDAEAKGIPVTLREAEQKTWEPAAQHCSPSP